MLYKGKVDDPNAYRGIVLECAFFKIRTKILTEADRPNRSSYTRTTVQVQERKVHTTCSMVFTTRHKRGSKIATEEATCNLY
jgi:hypothetical protein